MTRLLSLALLVAGVFLLLRGIDASQGIGSELSRLFTGSPTDRSLWLLLGGLVIGARGLFRGGKAV